MQTKVEPGSKWPWLKKPEFQNGLPWQVETWRFVLRSFNFEPHPNGTLPKRGVGTSNSGLLFPREKETPSLKLRQGSQTQAGGYDSGPLLGVSCLYDSWLFDRQVSKFLAAFRHVTPKKVPGECRVNLVIRGDNSQVANHLLAWPNIQAPQNHRAWATRGKGTRIKALTVSSHLIAC